ncbi:hypothetical protein GCM10022252_45530 [Streptosporangium oxazolinicum]|uniref:Tyr recombinase domain-containing protein n=1 Tax=Streptosporangium oxazolinicum TaxID=909287 RepID=A0ABP8B3X7_9ACTN
MPARTVPRAGRSPNRRARANGPIALPPPLIVLLKLHEAQRLEREAAGDRWREWDPVWCTPDGNPIDAGDDWKQLLQLAESDKDARVHDAHHTAATLLLEQGVDIRVIQTVLGHSQLTTTKRYTHITRTLATEAAARTRRALRDG